MWTSGVLSVDGWSFVASLYPFTLVRFDHDESLRVTGQ